MEESLFLPVLSHFENKNFWTASGGRMRYRVDPVLGKDQPGRMRYRVDPVLGEDQPPALTAQVWEGPWRLQDSAVEETRSFPMTEEGLEELRAWALDWQEKINARSPKTLAQTIQDRDARRAALAEQQGE